MEVFERITDAFFGLDRDWRFTYLNPEAERLLGRSRDDLVGKSVWEEFPEAVGSTFQREYERASRTGEAVSFEEYYPPLSTWFEVSAYPSEEGLSVYFRGINERKRMEEALLESERRLRAILVQYSSDVVTILEADGTVRYQSPAIERMLGYDPDELVGEDGFGYVHPEDREGTREAFAEVLRTPGPYGPLEFRFRHKDGSWRHLEAIGNNLLSDPDVRGIVFDSRDVTERKAAEEEIKESQQRYRSVVENVKEVIFQTDAAGRWTFLNPAWEEITGFAVEGSLGEDFLGYVNPDDRERNLEEFRPLVEGKKDHCRHEVRYLTRDGGFRWVEVYARLTLAPDGSVLGTSGTLNDVTERKALEERLEHQAFHDYLTGLPNRALFFDRLEHALKGSRRGGDPTSLLYLDLDGFKAVNDSLGHEAGDELLIETSRRIEGCVRPSDTVARLGGDEFAVVLERCPPERAEEIARLIEEELSRPFGLCAGEVRASASVGRARTEAGDSGAQTEAEEAARLLSEADRAMYRRKRERPERPG